HDDVFAFGEIGDLVVARLRRVEQEGVGAGIAAQRVVAGSAFDRIVAFAAQDGVVALAAIDLVVSAETLDEVIPAKRVDVVVALGADDPLRLIGPFDRVLGSTDDRPNRARQRGGHAHARSLRLRAARVEPPLTRADPGSALPVALPLGKRGRCRGAEAAPAAGAFPFVSQPIAAARCGPPSWLICSITSLLWSLISSAPS